MRIAPCAPERALLSLPRWAPFPPARGALSALAVFRAFAHALLQAAACAPCPGSFPCIRAPYAAPWPTRGLDAEWLLLAARGVAECQLRALVLQRAHDGVNIESIDAT